MEISTAVFMAFGLFMFYTWTHFYVLQFTKVWSERTDWEKFITVLAPVFFVLYMMGVN